MNNACHRHKKGILATCDLPDMLTDVLDVNYVQPECRRHQQCLHTVQVRANLGHTLSKKSATASEVSRSSLSCSVRLRGSYCVEPGTACSTGCSVQAQQHPIAVRGAAPKQIYLLDAALIPPEELCLCM